MQTNTPMRTVVVAQLVEWSLPMPEVLGLNPVTGKNLYLTFTVNCIEKTKIKKKRPGMAHFLKKNTYEQFKGTSVKKMINTERI